MVQSTVAIRGTCVRSLGRAVSVAALWLAGLACNPNGASRQSSQPALFNEEIKIAVLAR